MRHLMFLAVVATLGGCPSPDPVGERAYIAPLDGQADVGLDLPLLVRTAGQLELPPDYPLPENFVRVVDLQDGGLVDGQVVRDDGDLWFVPDDGWQPDRRYAWTVDDVLPEAHGPEFDFPDHLRGTAVFDTSSNLALLGAGTAGETAGPCLVFSRPLRPNDASRIVITANDVLVEDVTFQELDVSELDTPQPSEGEVGPGIVCIDSPTSIAAGAAIRVYFGEQGPWLAYLRDGPAENVIRDLRRGAW